MQDKDAVGSTSYSFNHSGEKVPEGPWRGMGFDLGLTDKDVHRAWNAFRHIDGDHSGHIELSELMELLHSLFPRMKPGILERYAKFAFNAADFDRSGQISFKEFLTVYAQMRKQHPAETAALSGSFDLPKRHSSSDDTYGAKRPTTTKVEEEREKNTEAEENENEKAERERIEKTLCDAFIEFADLKEEEEALGEEIERLEGEIEKEKMLKEEILKRLKAAKDEAAKGSTEEREKEKEKEKEKESEKEAFDEKVRRNTADFREALSRKDRDLKKIEEDLSIEKQRCYLLEEKFARTKAKLEREKKERKIAEEERERESELLEKQKKAQQEEQLKSNQNSKKKAVEDSKIYLMSFGCIVGTIVVGGVTLFFISKNKD